MSMKSSLVKVVMCLLAGVFSQSLAAQAPAEASELVAAAGSPTASVLRIIRFSGSVPLMQGQSIAGPVGVTFALYAEQEGSSPLWLETQNVELDQQGRYTALLGATSSDGLPLEIFTAGEARWLGIQVQGQPEQPRILLVSVPYALRAEEAQRLAGREASEFLLAEQLEREVRQVVETSVVEEMEAQGLTTTAEGVTRTITDGASTFTDSNSTEVVLVTQSGSGKGLRATTTGSIGVEGAATASSGTAIGVLGTTASSSGRGVQGSATSASGTTYAVRGDNASANGRGVFGFATATAGTNFGVVGQTLSTNGRALQGFATATTGTTYAVRGDNSSANGRGVLGIVSAASGTNFGVLGQSVSTSGRGVFGVASAGSGSTIGWPVPARAARLEFWVR
jgi:hypothetical protein